MACELRSVVCRYGQYAVFERAEHGDYCTGKLLRVLSILELLHEQPVGIPLYDGDYCMLVVRPDYGVHFQVTEPPAVRLCGPLVYADPVGDVYPFCPHWPAAVLESVP